MGLCCSSDEILPENPIDKTSAQEKQINKIIKQLRKSVKSHKKQADTVTPGL